MIEFCSNVEIKFFLGFTNYKWILCYPALSPIQRQASKLNGYNKNWLNYGKLNERVKIQINPSHILQDKQCTNLIDKSDDMVQFKFLNND